MVHNTVLYRKRAHTRPLPRERGHVGSRGGRNLGYRFFALLCHGVTDLLYLPRRLSPIVVLDAPISLLLLAERDVKIGVKVTAERRSPRKRPSQPPLVRL